MCSIYVLTSINTFTQTGERNDFDRKDDTKLTRNKANTHKATTATRARRRNSEHSYLFNEAASEEQAGSFSFCKKSAKEKDYGNGEEEQEDVCSLAVSLIFTIKPRIIM